MISLGQHLSSSQQATAQPVIINPSVQLSTCDVVARCKCASNLLSNVSWVAWMRFSAVGEKTRPYLAVWWLCCRSAALLSGRGWTVSEAPLRQPKTLRFTVKIVPWNFPRKSCRNRPRWREKRKKKHCRWRRCPEKAFKPEKQQLVFTWWLNYLIITLPVVLFTWLSHSVGYFLILTDVVVPYKPIGYI